MSSELLASAENTLKGNLGGAWDILNGYADAYTDLGIGKQFGGAAAAYSLRDVGAMNGPVVRVRRDSDNSEQDFPASAVTQIPDWCNQSVIKPLDVRELNSGGSGDRDGNFVIAKAAYSLRSLGDRQATTLEGDSPLDEDTVQAPSGKYVVQVRRNVNNNIKSFTADEVADGTLLSFVNESFTSSLPLDVRSTAAAAAYSLRNLKTGGTSVTSSGDTSGSTTGKFVVQVKRFSDDFIKSFTAEEVSDGTLLSFVTEPIQKTLSVTPLNESSTWDVTVVDDSNYTIDCNNNTGTEKCQLISGAISVSGSTKYRVEFDFVTNSGDASNLKLNRSSGFLSKDIVEGRNSIEFDFTQNTNLLWRVTAGNTFNVTISNLVVTAISNDGSVRTWYDQSGNDNHATQTTNDSQPKIVESGSLVSLGVDFTGGKFMPFTSISAKTVAAVNQLTDTTNFNYLIGRSGGGDGGARTSSGNGLFTGADTASSASSDFNNAGGTTHLNSSQSSFLSTNPNVYFATATSGFAVTALGTAFEFSGVSRSWRGKIAEVIIYTADASQQRRAIEESMQGNYSSSITLGSFSRDGFVRALYDQSVSNQAGTASTGRHAIQDDHAKQASIVTNGALNASGGLEFDGVDDFYNISSLSFENKPLSMFCLQDAQGSTNDGTIGSAADKGIAFKRNNVRYTLTGSTIDTNVSGVSDGDLKLLTVIHNGTTNANNIRVALDGTLLTAATSSGANGSNAITQLGSLDSAEGGHFLKNTFKEFLIYDTDQTDNRGAFEANIAEHYNISGMPTEDNQVNGFVETLYDQSGNGRDVTQTTATEQPKIVSSGSLVTSNGLPAIDFTSSLTRLTVSEFLTGQLNSYFVVVQIEAGDSSESQLPWRQGSNYRLANEFKAANGNIQLTVRDGAGDQGSPNATGDLANGTVRLITSLIKARGANGNTIFVDGGNQANADSTDVEDTDFSAADSGNFSIGGIANSGGFDSHGKGSEFIFFNTDQSANRTNIESNIANYYGITLS